MRRLIILGITLSVVLGARGVLAVLANAAAENPSLNWEIPGGCVEAQADDMPATPFAGADITLARTIRCGAVFLDVAAAEFFSQGHAKESVRGWSPPSAGQGSWHRASFNPSMLDFTVNQFERKTADGNVELAWHWYAIGDRPAWAVVRAKLLQGLQVLRLQPTHSAVFTITARGPDAVAVESSTDAVATMLWSRYVEALRK